MSWTALNWLTNRSLPSWANPWTRKVRTVRSTELISILEDKDRTIRKLTKKIEKLEDTLKRATKEKGSQERRTEEPDNDNKYLELLKTEISKT